MSSQKQALKEITKHMHSLLAEGYSASDLVKKLEKKMKKEEKISTGYHQTLNTFFPGPPPNNDNYHLVLPVGTYSINYDCVKGYFLKKISDFEISTKLYGDLTKNADRILKTFLDREGSTGALLCGMKGTGKTLSTKYISVEASKLEIPTIVINSCHCGEAFNHFIQQITQHCVIIFDEYEKVYRHKQELLLTLLDGVYPTKKLFLLTSNDRSKIGEKMLNRPGRLFYVVDFHGVNWELIKSYLEENLNNKANIEKVAAIAILMNKPNFDMIKALVEEMNRYDESPVEALKLLNIRPHFDDNGHNNFIVKCMNTKSGDKEEKCTSWIGNPMIDRIKLESVVLDCQYFVKVEPKERSLLFEKDGYKVKLTAMPQQEFTWCKIGCKIPLNNDHNTFNESSNIKDGRKRVVEVKCETSVKKLNLAGEILEE